jgi:hypothetical protein
MLMNTSEIEVDIEDAYRYMGCRGDIEPRTKTELQNAAELIKKHIKPRVVQKICDLDRSDGLSLEGTCLKLYGKGIDALLHDCDICAIFCSTIGGDIEPLIRKWEIKDLAFAAMLDACASSAVESLCDSVENEIAMEYASQGFYLTDRFSPGYGDLPVAIQKDFCAALDTSRRIGVSVSDSGIMIPRKSVTAIIGISGREQKHRIYGCRDCILIKNCKFRENGVTCYGQAV